jgi:transcriptional regulator with XRE-family HTH domain
MLDCTQLQMAINYLKDKGAIEKDIDVATELKVSKGTLSNYKSGKVIMSKNFIDKFENHYKLKLSNFTENGSKKSGSDEVLDTKNEMINLLKEEVARLRKQVDERLTFVQETIQEIYAIVSGNQRLLNVLAGIDLVGEEDLDVKPYRKPGKDQKKKGNPN